MKTLVLLAVLAAIALHAQSVDPAEKGDGMPQACRLDLGGNWRLSPDDRAEYAQPAWEDSSWQLLKLPTERTMAGLIPTRTVLWLRRNTRLPAACGDSSLSLTIGWPAVNEVFVNGRRIDGTAGIAHLEQAPIPRPESYRIPAEALRKDGQMSVAIRFLRPVMHPSWQLADVGPYLITSAALTPVNEGVNQINAQHLRYTPDLLFGSAYLTMAAVFLAGWLSFRREGSLLWFSLFLAARSLISASIVYLVLPLPIFDRQGTGAFQMITGSLSEPVLTSFALVALGTGRVAGHVWNWALWSILPACAFLYAPNPYPIAGNFACQALGAGYVLWDLWRRHRNRTFEDNLFRLTLLVPLALGTWLWGLVIAQGVFRAAGSRVPVWMLGPYGINSRDMLLLPLISAVGFLLLRHVLQARREYDRLAADVEAARLVQRLILPVSGAEGIEAVYEPAQSVGGDFYFLSEVRDGGRVVALGDVSGKGLKAAMLVSVVMGALRQSDKTSPAAILGDLNRVLTGSHIGGAFVTCVCVRVDAASRTVTIANAGHPAPYLDGAEYAGESGLPLGVVADVTYTEASTAMPGVLTLVSDGVLEAENANRELFGFERTREISTRSASEIAEAARAWGQNDDITVVTVRRTS